MKGGVEKPRELCECIVNCFSMNFKINFVLKSFEQSYFTKLSFDLTQHQYKVQLNWLKQLAWYRNFQRISPFFQIPPI